MTRPLTTTCVALAALVLGGCSGDPKPDIADPTTAPSTSSSATTAPEPSTPATTTAEPEVLSPEDTVRAWVRGYNRALTSGETSLILDMSLSTCPQCQQVARNFQGLYDAGGSISSDGWIVERLKQRPDFSKTGQVAASIISSKSVITRTPGAEPETEARETFFVQWTLTEQRGRWLVRDLAFIS